MYDACAGRGLTYTHHFGSVVPTTFRLSCTNRFGSVIPTMLLGVGWGGAWGGACYRSLLLAGTSDPLSAGTSEPVLAGTTDAPPACASYLISES